MILFLYQTSAVLHTKYVSIEVYVYLLKLLRQHDLVVGKSLDLNLKHEIITYDLFDPGNIILP